MKKKKLLIILGGVLALLLIAAAVVIFVFVLPGRGEQEEEGIVPEEPVVLPVVEAPLTYVLGELDSIIALPVGDTIIVTEEVAEVPEEEEAAEEETAESEEDAAADGETGGESAEEGGETPSAEPEVPEEPLPADTAEVSVTYYYEGFAAPQERIALYCGILTGEDMGFVPVDEARMETEMPPIDGWMGSVHLVRQVVPKPTEEGGEPPEIDPTLFSLRISWRGNLCSVAVGQIAGRIVEPPPPPPPQPMTMAGAVEYFYSCEPAKLGLTGSSMEAYQVFPMDGAVLVGTTPCLKMNVYAVDPETGTNEIAGQYLLSNDGLSLYFLDTEGNLLELER